MSKKKSKIKKKLVKKYRLVILTNDSYEEKFSFKLNRLNVFVFGGLFSLLLIVVTSVFIIYTPLKEYIPGFESPELKKNAVNLNFKLDSLEQKMHTLELYTESIKPALIGDAVIETEALPYVTKKGESVYQAGISNNDSIHKKMNKLYALLDEKNETITSLRKKFEELSFDVEVVSDVQNVEVDALSAEALASLENSKLDSVFRAKIEKEEQFSISGNTEETSQLFVAPITGKIIEEFNVVAKQYAVSIATVKGTPVKAIADGVVVFSEWSLQTGYVVIIVHHDNYVSVYKNNSKVNVSQGELVTAGQIIANVGSLNERGLKSYLHFEIWKEGYPVDPTNFMKF